MGSVCSTGLSLQDKNNRQQPPSHWMQAKTFGPELSPESGSSSRTMEATTMTLNLKTLLLTMMMFKWGKKSSEQPVCVLGWPEKQSESYCTSYLNVFIFFSSSYKERTKIKRAKISSISDRIKSSKLFH